jgi:hypothetical protein
LRPAAVRCSGVAEVAPAYAPLLPDLAQHRPGFAYGASLALVLVGLAELTALVGLVG